ncbi:hypothetical protein GW17_00014878 [Ensete ventricosum]|nr:hypothetical protein GW17_00014878 [Ensete ventricosum]
MRKYGCLPTALYDIIMSWSKAMTHHPTLASEPPRGIDITDTDVFIDHSVRGLTVFTVDMTDNGQAHSTATCQATHHVLGRPGTAAIDVQPSWTMMRARRSTILSNTDTVLEDLGPAKPYTISVRDTSGIKGRGTVVPRLAGIKVTPETLFKGVSIHIPPWTGH